MHLDDFLVGLAQRVQALEHRVAGARRFGVVSEVDTSRRLLRARIGGTDDEPVLTAWIPWTEIAGGPGGINVAWAPHAGQNVVIDAAGGDVAQGVASPLTWSDDHGAVADTADGVIRFGQTTIKIEPGRLVTTVGGSEIVQTPDGIMLSMGGTSMILSSSGVNFIGGVIRHDGVSIDRNHVHGGVIPGGANTDVPSN